MTMTWLTNAAIAVWISTNSVLILLYGLAGMKSHPAVTAAVMVGPLVVIARKFQPRRADYLFAALAALMVASVVVNGRTATDRDYVLLAVSLAAYPALRAVGSRFDLLRFSYITAAIVLVGTVLTAWAVVNDRSGEFKPLVLGFHEGPTVFCLTWCFLVFALLSMNLPSFQWRVSGGLIVLPSFVFAAALVRHPFIALALTLAATVRTGSRRQLAVVGIVGLTILVGLAARPEMSGRIIGLVVENVHKPVVTCDTKDTFAIRIILTKEALNLLPKAGLLGQGIGTFAQQSCYKAEPHNVVLQVAVEVGVAAAVLLVALYISAMISAAKRARFDAAASFVFAGLVFVGIEFLISGSLTNSALFFGFMGWAVGLPQKDGREIGAEPHPLANG
ncbi:hypothetical protein [Bradyrhizobium diazoefficiens]|uniref:hypothetical protein n=1 Tax=Bradyrhizobium diazoefficiens TaxID=1355477 RepID=UPI00271456C3|nr:hypothetical protein [Bradyrhizobium diazoefficiens]WLA54310.1 hypothetical protein QIH81_27605 [Bradyrhizobium diazoefficiens]